MQPMNEQIETMKKNIDKVKEILKKTQTLKEELKYDIYEMDIQIDDYI